MKKILLFLCIALSAVACTKQDIEKKKGIRVSTPVETDEQTGNTKASASLNVGPEEIVTRPGRVILTKHPQYRLIPVFKLNYNKKGEPYTGRISKHRFWAEETPGHNRNGNFMPGTAAAYGYKLMNISLSNFKEGTQQLFFDEPALIKTLYYPAISEDSINFKPVVRDYYMVSVYDEDTNGDGFIDFKDLRRFYLFDLEGKLQKALIPKSYGVLSSEYDIENDIMFVSAKLDANKNGKLETEEETHIFSINLKTPEEVRLIYGTGSD